MDCSCVLTRPNIKMEIGRDGRIILMLTAQANPEPKGGACCKVDLLLFTPPDTAIKDKENGKGVAFGDVLQPDGRLMASITVDHGHMQQITTLLQGPQADRAVFDLTLTNVPQPAAAEEMCDVALDIRVEWG